ncbi:MAG: hypothetical protein IPI88_04325 [Chitinophagaceae bacterium]|nr:hypothetical protein [Chitinophagaceae bacterium]
MKQENISDSIVESFSKKIGNLEEQRDVFTFRHFQKLRAICTNEQKIRFDSIIQQALRQMGPPRGPRPEFGKDRPGEQRRNDGPLPKPGMKPDGKRPPADGMRPAGGPPPSARYAAGRWATTTSSRYGTRQWTASPKAESGHRHQACRGPPPKDSL